MSWNEPGGKDKDPWSDRNNSSPPDLDEVMRSLQNKLSGLFGGGSDHNPNDNNGLSATSLSLIGGGLLLLWSFSGFYTVDQGSRGLVTRLGAYNRTTTPGLNWHLPAPFEQVKIVNIEQQRFIEVGYRSGNSQSAGSVPKESMMLTKDENIVDVRLTVQYQIKDARDFAFNVTDKPDPTATLKQVTESVERAVIGRSDMDYVLTEGRSEIVQAIKSEIQSVMDSYHAGIVVTSVNLQDAQPPDQVQGAFDDAIKAREDKQRLINEAEAYSNDVVPKARGLASRIVQESEAYKERVIAQANGDVSRFNQLLVAYKKAPSITRERMYLETIETVLGNANTIVIDAKSGNNMLYLPVDKLLNKTSEAGMNTSSEQARETSTTTVTAAPVARETKPDVRAFSRERDARGSR